MQLAGYIFLWNLYLTFSENYHLKSYAGFLLCLRHKGTNSEEKVLVLRKVQKHTLFFPNIKSLKGVCVLDSASAHCAVVAVVLSLSCCN